MQIMDYRPLDLATLDVEILAGRQLSRAEALQLYAMAAEPERAEPLLDAASRLRDRVFGNAIFYMATMAPILPCALEPKCEYCDFWRARVIQRSKMAAGAEALAARGVKRMMMVGGSRDGDFDTTVIDIVQRIRDAGVNIDIEINVGGCLTGEGIARLRELGVVGIAASLETVNAELFQRHKPGDSLPARRRLLADAQAQGFEVRSIMMMGLGESDADRIDHLLELRSHTGLRHLMISRFEPRHDTPLADHPVTTLHDWARTVALARLLLPLVRIGFGGGVDHAELALWRRAGGGNQFFALGVHTMEPPAELRESAQELGNGIYLIDRRPMLDPVFAALGLRPTFEDPDARIAAVEKPGMVRA